MNDRCLNYDEYSDKLKIENFVSPHIILCDGIEHLSNLGLILRSAESVGISKVLIAGASCQLNDVKLSRLSRSASRRVEVTSISLSEVKKLREEYTLLVIDITQKSSLLYDFKFDQDQKYMLIFGSESRGISKNLIQLAHYSLHLPIYGPQSSINVACAATSAMHYLTYQTI